MRGKLSSQRLHFVVRRVVPLGLLGLSVVTLSLWSHVRRAPAQATELVHDLTRVVVVMNGQSHDLLQTGSDRGVISAVVVIGRVQRFQERPPRLVRFQIFQM